jgi:hypothetical protein
MKFQTKNNNYSVIIKKSYYKRFADGERELVPGLKARFVGPQRIFDSELAQKRHEWTDEERVYVENRLLKSPRFNNGIYLAPGESLSKEQMEIASSLPAALKPKCQFIWTEDEDIKQCGVEVGVGQEFCLEHDDKKPKILKGPLVTT